MQEVLETMIYGGGFQIIAPEHRLSLELKQLELSLSNDKISGDDQSVIDILDDLLDHEGYINIFDESDAIYITNITLSMLLAHLMH